MSLEELWRLFPIILREHNTNYQAWYEEEKNNLVRLLTHHHVIRVNHIGSTSVAGLIAKPIIDILLELSADYDMDAIARLMRDNGWILMKEDKTLKTLDLNKGYTPDGFAEKVYHLHIKPSGDWDELYFRDYLRQNPLAARQYEALKLNLLEQFKHNRDAYTDAKSEFVMEHTRKAREEYGGRYSPSQCRRA